MEAKYIFFYPLFVINKKKKPVSNLFPINVDVKTVNISTTSEIIVPRVTVEFELVWLASTTLPGKGLLTN